MKDSETGTYQIGKWIIREDWPLWVIMFLSLLAGIYIYPSLPDKIPTHWDLHGEINGWSSRGMGVFGLLVLNLGVYIMLLFLPLIDPRRQNYANFQPTLRIIRACMVILLTAIWGIALWAGKTEGKNLGNLIPAVLSIFFIILGNLMGRIRYNWFFGIRTPWSLDNEEAWRKTHRASGPAWVIGGMIGLIGSWMGVPLAFWFMAVGLGGATLFSIVYSYFAWKSTSSRIS